LKICSGWWLETRGWMAKKRVFSVRWVVDGRIFEPGGFDS
jgi:hypothetical protein